MDLFETIAADLRAPVERDPAAQGVLDVVLSYPGFHALTAHRAIHALHCTGMPLVPRFLSNVVRFLTGIEIHPGARIGKGVFIDHGTGVVIGETAEVGDNVTIYQGVTIGGTSLGQGKRHPTLGNDVVVGANASILGPIVVGSGARVGAGSVVVKDVPPNSTAIGLPARVVAEDGKPLPAPPDAARIGITNPPDVLITQLQARVAVLERRLAEMNANEYDDAIPAI